MWTRKTEGLCCNIKRLHLYLLLWRQRVCCVVVCGLLIGQYFYTLMVVSPPVPLTSCWWYLRYFHSKCGKNPPFMFNSLDCTGEQVSPAQRPFTVCFSPSFPVPNPVYCQSYFKNGNVLIWFWLKSPNNSTIPVSSQRHWQWQKSLWNFKRPLLSSALSFWF